MGTGELRPSFLDATRSASQVPRQRSTGKRALLARAEGHSQMENRVNSFYPEKWLRILQRWRPRERLEVLEDFLKSLIKSAGAQRGERLDDLIVHTDETTRSGREKFDKLRRWRDAMRSDLLFWPHLVKRERPVSMLVKKIVDGSSRPLTRFEVERKFRRHRRVPSTGLAQELKELAKSGEIDRLAAGVYWRKGKATAPCDSYAQRAYRLVYSASEHRVHEAALAAALRLTRKDTATLVCQLRRRGLFSSATGKGFVVASAESLAILQQGPIFDGRGGIFFAPMERHAPSGDDVFTAIRAERLRIARQPDSAERLSKSAQRHLRKERAREQWREDATKLMEQFPERSPKPLRELFRSVGIDGLTRQIFKDVIRDVAVALLREKGLKTSWTEPGAPSRGNPPKIKKSWED